VSAPGVWYDTQAGSVRRARIRSLADVRAVEKVPYTDLLPACSVLGVLEASSTSFPDKLAIVAAGKSDPTTMARRFTYSEVVALVRADGLLGPTSPIGRAARPSRSKWRATFETRLAYRYTRAGE
jgi:hypothetical protein